MEGLRWAWNSWPTSSNPSSSTAQIPLSVMLTPLTPFTDDQLPLLPYDPVSCPNCNAVLNPYARVDYPSRTWLCPFCHLTSPFPRAYNSASASDDNDHHSLPAELFPTYSTVEYILKNNMGLGLAHYDGNGPPLGVVFVVDLGIGEEEMKVVKGELVRAVEGLPDKVLIGLVSFDISLIQFDST